MRRLAQILLCISWSLAMTAAAASQLTYLSRNTLICDEPRDFCLRGSLSYNPNPRLLRLNGRVQKAPGPGLLRITLTGTNRLGHRRFAPMELRLRGTYSEIVDHKMIPDYPDIYAWSVDRVEYQADEQGPLE